MDDEVSTASRSLMMKCQQGAALIVVLSLLTVSLMVGLSSMQSSQIDERLAGNYKAITEAQMMTERSASFIISSGRDYSDNSGVLCDSIIEAPSEHSDSWESISEDIGVSGAYSSRYLPCEKGGSDLFVVESIVDGAVRYLVAGVPQESGLGMGLLSGGALSLNGTPSLVGPVHSNGDISIPDMDDPSSYPDAFITSSYNNPDVEDKDIPNPLSSYIYSIDTASENVQLECNLDNKASLNDGVKIVFCNGNMSVKKNFSGTISDVVLVSTGSMVFNGNYESNTSFVAGGSIDFKGNRDVEGILWAAGSIALNGGPSVKGSIIANGSVNIVGGLDYEFDCTASSGVLDTCGPGGSGGEDDGLVWQVY